MLFRLTLFLCIAISFNSVANESLSQQQTTTRIEQLVNDDVTLPKDMIAELDQIIDLSKQQGWQKNHIAAGTLKTELLAFLEDLPKAKSLLKELKPIAKANNYPQLLIRLKLVELTLLSANSYTDEVRALVEELISAADSWGDTREAGEIYNAVGYSYYSFGRLDKALIYLRKAHKIFTQLNDTSNLAYTINTLANVYSDIGDTQNAVSLLEEALAIKSALNDNLSSSIITYNLGKTLTEDNQLEKAKDYLQQSLALSIKIDDEIGAIWAKQGIAEVYIRQQQPEKAIVLLKQTAKVFNKTGDTRELFSAYLGLFDSYYMLEQYQNAQVALTKLEQLKLQLDNPTIKNDVIWRQALMAHSQHNNQNAYLLMKTFAEAQKQIFENQKKQKVDDLKASFDTHRQEQKHLALKKENELNLLKLKQKNMESRLWIIISCMALVIILVIGTLLYRQYKSRALYKTLALKDTLTGSANRRAILRTAELTLKQARQNNTRYAIAIADLDKFKKVNDQYGHDVGDEVLKAFTKACSLTLRKSDSYGRYGGEEWLFVFEDADNDNIIAIFNRIYQKLNAMAISGYPNTNTLSFSVGVAIRENQDITEEKSSTKSSTKNKLQQLINSADTNLYQAKKAGRSRLAFSQQMHGFS